MNTSGSAAALEAELRVVEEDLARLRETSADLRRRIGEREDEPTDPAERSALIEQAEEQEALIDMLKARREELLRELSRPGTGTGPVDRPLLSDPGLLDPTAVSGKAMSSKDLPSALMPQTSSTSPPMIMMPPPTRYPMVRPARSVPPPISAP
jgi:outer membrane protein TolC